MLKINIKRDRKSRAASSRRIVWNCTSESFFFFFLREKRGCGPFLPYCVQMNNSDTPSSTLTSTWKGNIHIITRPFLLSYFITSSNISFHYTDINYQRLGIRVAELSMKFSSIDNNWFESTHFNSTDRWSNQSNLFISSITNWKKRLFIKFVRFNCELNVL